MAANEKLVMKDEELDMISGGTSWTCERTGDRVIFVSERPSGPDYIRRDINNFGLADALKFMDEHKGDVFQTADGKAFTL